MTDERPEPPSWWGLVLYVLGITGLGALGIGLLYGVFTAGFVTSIRLFLALGALFAFLVARARYFEIDRERG